MARHSARERLAKSTSDCSGGGEPAHLLAAAALLHVTSRAKGNLADICPKNSKTSLPHTSGAHDWHLTRSNQTLCCWFVSEATLLFFVRIRVPPPAKCSAKCLAKAIGTAYNYICTINASWNHGILWSWNEREAQNPALVSGHAVLLSLVQTFIRNQRLPTLLVSNRSNNSLDSATALLPAFGQVLPEPKLSSGAGCYILFHPHVL